MKTKALFKRCIAALLTTVAVVTCVGATNVSAATTAMAENDVDQDSYIAMLNYVALMNDEINTSSNNKVMLDEVYASLMNNTAPHAIDSRTQVQLNNMLQTIDNYRMIDVKRERIEYLYQQAQAEALRAAVPNPIGLLSGVKSVNLVQLVASGVYMAIDSKARYDSAKAQATNDYLKSGWELEDQETKELNKSQENLFNYMIDMVNTSGMNDKYALPNDVREEYVKYKNNSNISRRIEYLETNRDTFEKFGDYWLTLSESYFKTKEYEKCIDAIDTYNNLRIEIFRKDQNLANDLPAAISSAQECIEDREERIQKISGYLSQLKRNIKTEDWALRYFAAQTDIYLYTETNDVSFISDAYQLTKTNVNYLIDEQNSLNAAYLAGVKEKTADKDATKEEKKEIKEYNKMLKEERKTELPPVYEPLYLNCDLLFALADKIGVSESEKTKIEKILHGDSASNTLFFTEPLDASYYFWGNHSYDSRGIIYKGASIVMPASLVSDHSKIQVIIKSSNNKTEISDWKVKNVNRKKAASVSEMTVTYTSKDAETYKYQNGDIVTVVITPVTGGDCPDVSIMFKTTVTKKYKVVNDISFERN